MSRPSWSVVVPTIGRPSLDVLLRSLARQQHRPARVVLVDDRRDPTGPLDTSVWPDALVLTGGGLGPAAARNRGWRATDTEWVVVLDDDVVLPPDWTRSLLGDLPRADPGDGEAPDERRTAAVAAHIRVPLPTDRCPTDWERSTAGLEQAFWATADMALRREALESVGGFDERFPRAYREDADLAARLRSRGWLLRQGERWITHPVRPADAWVSLRVQRGNADDALMRAVHGPQWRSTTSCLPGRFAWHVATVVAGLAALVAAAAGHRRVAVVAGGAWAALTGDFARRRIVPGPRTGPEVRAMLLTSAAIPPASLWWRLLGTWRSHGATAWSSRVRAVLLDRDGTLVHDVPYNGDPQLVRPVDGAHDALHRLRRAGLRLGVVSNQSGIGRGLLDAEEVAAVNARVDALLGPFATWQVCPHTDDDGCACRKPAPGMVRAAARDLGVAPHECVVIGDIGADVEAARAAGARAVLVPTATTRLEEVRAADVVAADLTEAVDLVLAAASGRRR